MITVRATREEDCLELAPKLRQEDVEEIRTASGLPPAMALRHGFLHSKPCNSIVSEDGAVIAMFGATPMADPLLGLVWMLASDELVQHRISFLRTSRSLLAGLHEQYPILFNYVDARNTTHIEWLRWLQFSFIGLETHYGVCQQPFYEFVRIKDDV